MILITSLFVFTAEDENSTSTVVRQL